MLSVKPSNTLNVPPALPKLPPLPSAAVCTTCDSLVNRPTTASAPFVPAAPSRTFTIVMLSLMPAQDICTVTLSVAMSA